MKAALIHRYGGEVVLEDRPQPQPGDGDLLVRVRAASVNPVDFKIAAGKLKLLRKDKMPLTLGSDLAGEVVAVGAGVRRFAVGDAIYARLDKDRIGSFAEYALVREGAAARRPPNLSWQEAASLPLVGLTSWQALIDVGKLAAGQTVLIHAGSGGIGTFAIQLAKHLGAQVATTASARNHELVKRLGADVVIDYRTTRFEDVLKDCDVVFDTQGGETLERSFKVLRTGGVVVTIGGRPDGKLARELGLNPLVVAMMSLLSRKVTRLARARQAHFQYLFMHPSGEQLERIGELVERGVIRPIVDRAFPLDEVKQALAYVETGRAVGKVIVSMG
jgi:alcohol dehydrogenase